MSIRYAATVLAAPDPGALCDFYRELLGWEEVERDGEWAQIRHPEYQRPRISFQLEKGHTPPVWPPREGTQEMQAHLDFAVDDLEGETQRAVALGARVAPDQTSEGIRILFDPVGHPFCLFLPGY